MWMTSTDDRGYVKYWQANLNNVHTFQAHTDPVRSSRWDNLVLLVVFLSSNYYADKLYQFCKNDEVYCKQYWFNTETHTFLLNYSRFMHLCNRKVLGQKPQL